MRGHLISPLNPQTPESVDLSRFEELSDGDRESLVELIQLYLTKTAEQLAELEKAIATQSSADVARLAHSMIGANAMVGIQSIIPVLRKIEAHGEESQISEAREAFNELQSAFKLIHQGLRQKLESLST